MRRWRAVFKPAVAERASTRNAILCASGLIALFSSGQDRGDCHSERKRIPAKWSIRVRRSRVPGLLCLAEGPRHDVTERVGFLWDCRNDAGMLYEGLTSALRPGQWSIIPQTELPRCVKQFSSFFSRRRRSFLASRDSGHATTDHFWILMILVETEGEGGREQELLFQ